MKYGHYAEVRAQELYWHQGGNGGGGDGCGGDFGGLDEAGELDWVARMRCCHYCYLGSVAALKRAEFAWLFRKQYDWGRDFLHENS